MTELLTAAQMRAVESAAIASGEVTGLELMERAGRGVVEAVFAEWPELRAGSFRAVVLCGPGNNGGDGFVVARLLKDWGWEVEVFLYGTPEGMPPDARVNYERWVGMGEVRGLRALNDAVAARPGITFEVVVDAFFGTGLSRPLPAAVADTFCNLFRGYLDGRVVAIDVPSGLCADSGRALVPPDFSTPPHRWPALEGLVAEAQLTVTFHRRKASHVLDVGPRHCGKVTVKDIGLQRGHGSSQIQATKAPGPYGEVGKVRIGANKFSHGHALILSGGPGHGGAARMAARGALRIGAGLVTVACAAEALAENAARLDAVMLRVVDGSEALLEVLADARINAVCIGPGLGLDARGAALVRVVLEASGGKVREITHPTSAARRVVLDADALTLISRDPALFAMLHPACVLTPHGGEFARLFPDIAAKLDAPAVKGPAYSKVDATREAAARAGCVVLFKGADTVIASPDGTCAVNSAAYERGAPWLATAGSGDVLAGFICGLLARGFAPQQAAETAAWLHVECARSFGPGLIAEDLAEELPKVFRALGV